MTDYVEVVSKVKKLSRSEKLTLIKVLADSLNEDSAEAASVGQPTPARRRRLAMKVDYKPGKFIPNEGSTFFKILGALSMEGVKAPSDEEVEKLLTDSLVEKYT